MPGLVSAEFFTRTGLDILVAHAGLAPPWPVLAPTYLLLEASGPGDPRHLLAGDALDFWRVEAIEPGKLLRLRAEMKLPGLAWLELSVGQDYDGMTTYSQRAIFRPRGLAGHAYWRSISPFHGVVFGGMLRNITAAAERAERAGNTPAECPQALDGTCSWRYRYM